MQYTNKQIIDKDALQKVNSLRKRGLPNYLILRYLKIQYPVLFNRKKGGVK